jgi:Cohesin domain/Dockerin type I domain
VKRSFIILLSLCSFMSFGTASAQNVITAAAVSGEPGIDVVLAITVTTENNIAGAEFQVTFDQTMLQIKETADGADANGVASVLVEIEDANSTGTLAVQMIDATTNPLTSGTDKELFVITFTIDADASGEIPIVLADAVFSDELGASTDPTIVNGSVTVSAVPETQTKPEGNYILIQDSYADPGSEVTVPIVVTSDQDIAGAQFTVNFDSTKLQVKEATLGADNPDMMPIGVATETANSTGKLAVGLLNTELENSFTAGTDKELFVITFTLESDVTAAIPLTLTSVSVGTVVGDTAAADVDVAVVNGTIFLSPPVDPGDVNDDGSINIFDLLGLLQILSGAGESTVGSDVNVDGSVNIFDLLALLSLLASG